MKVPQMRKFVESYRKVRAMRQHFPHRIFSASYSHTNRVNETLFTTVVGFRNSPLYRHPSLSLVGTVFGYATDRQFKMSDYRTKHLALKLFDNFSNRTLIVQSYAVFTTRNGHPRTHSPMIEMLYSDGTILWANER